MEKGLNNLISQPSSQDGFLPDFCQGEGLLAVVVISELLALLIAVVSHGLPSFDWVFFAKASMMSLWISLLSALLLCKLRPWLSQQEYTKAAFVSFISILLVAFFLWCSCGRGAVVGISRSCCGKL